MTAFFQFLMALLTMFPDFFEMLFGMFTGGA